MKKSLKITAIVFAIMLMFNACGGGGEKTPVATNVQETQSATPATSALSNVLMLEGNDKMQFNENEFRVAAGKTITLTLTHTGIMEKNVMGHNFVLLTKGTDIYAFAKKAMEAKENDYIPKSESANVITHTKLLGGGESDTITFTVAEKGTYDFICSFPGHVAMMKGKLIVE